MPILRFLLLILSVIQFSCENTDSVDRVWVGRSDGSKSCEEAPGVALEITKSELEKSKIKVYESKKVDDGLLRAQMCGIEKGISNAYLIDRSNLDLVQGLGFVLMKIDSSQ
ncbi:MAG: hypothetical protein CL678_14970 [Bdellovibrionaceae bacterium]|nr:hypothetical protein [Pseudobdellovibrionaceae bacterium]|tara:strand:+ start:5138 stop:5470 length:333 start_codon:yes stop_codon:yes gene_type:complete